MKMKLKYSLSFAIVLFMLTFVLNIQAGGQSLKPVKLFKAIGKANFSKNLNANGKKLYKDDELVVVFKKTFTLSARSQMIKQYALNKAFSFGKNKHLHLIKLKSGQSVHQAYAQFKSDPNVVSVRYNYLAYALAIPNDSRYSSQWGLNNTGQTFSNLPGIPGADMGMQLAWNVRTDCSAVTVAVVDSGVNYTHQDLAANIVTADMFNYATTPNNSTPYPAAGHESHGTHVVGTIGAIGNNGIGTSGVCWQAKILPVRVLDENGAGGWAQVIAGIDHAIGKNAKVINLSLGGPASPAEVVELNAVMNRALASNVVVVIAAGNDGTNNDSTPIYPCSLTQPNIICVAATDNRGARAAFSNIGSVSVDVGAPGVSVLSTIPGATIVDSTTGWTRTGAWTEGQCGIDGNGVLSSTSPLKNVLMNPSNFCAVGATYSNSANDVAYKTFNLSGLQFATAYFSIFYELEATDKIDFARNITGADPFSASGTAIGPIVGGSSTPGGTGSVRFLDPVNQDCLVANCALGFRLVSVNTGTAGTGKGVGLYDIVIETVSNAPQTNAYAYFQGTSMASPHVAGLAALLIAQNPNFTYLDTINAIKNGGVANPGLAGVTTSGRSVSAIGSLRYTATPTGVSVTVP